MISKRWLAQSSAVGLFGAAVLSLPFWIDGAAPPEDEEPAMSCCEPATASGHESSDEAGGEAWESSVTVRSLEANEVGQRTGEGVEETTRTIRVRYHLENAYPGPMCPADVEPRPPDVLQW